MAESFLLHFSLPCFDSAGIPNLICPVTGVQSTRTTNTLGNIYYPISLLGHDGWIFITGYKAAKFPTGAVNYKVVFEKE
jgi:hypothetical protein